MESEVLRSQLQARPRGSVLELNGVNSEACSEDLVRLKEEMAACKEELAEGPLGLRKLRMSDVFGSLNSSFWRLAQARRIGG